MKTPPDINHQRGRLQIAEGVDLHQPAHAVFIRMKDDLAEIVNSNASDRVTYAALAAWFASISNARTEGMLTAADVDALCVAFSSSLENGSMRGRSLLQKYGYVGYFRTVDEIYPSVFGSDAVLKNRGKFHHAQGIPNTSLNRPAYFKQLVSDALVANPQGVEVLHVASGFHRDIAKFCESNPTAQVKFTCVESDGDALAEAKAVCSQWLDRMTFVHSHALSLQLDPKFDLVWSAGRFDYFDDRGYVAMLLTRLISLLKPDSARVVICNLMNPDRSATRQEVGDWFLNYRTPEQVVELAIACTPATSSIDAKHDEEGVDFLLRVAVGQQR